MYINESQYVQQQLSISKKWRTWDVKRLSLLWELNTKAITSEIYKGEKKKLQDKTRKKKERDGQQKKSKQTKTFWFVYISCYGKRCRVVFWSRPITGLDSQIGNVIETRVKVWEKRDKELGRKKPSSEYLIRISFYQSFLFKKKIKDSFFCYRCYRFHIYSNTGIFSESIFNYHVLGQLI